MKEYTHHGCIYVISSLADHATFAVNIEQSLNFFFSLTFLPHHIASLMDTKLSF